MNNATNYLKPYKDHYWDYVDDARVIETGEGLTIAYTEQVLNEFIPHLAPQGLPGFGALLLAIAATNPNGTSVLDSISAPLSAEIKNLDDVKKGYAFAELLTTVPEKMKGGKFRILLLQAIFQNSHNGVGLRKAALIAEQISSPGFLDQLAQLEPEELTDYQYKSRVSADFKTLALAGRELPDVPTLLQRVAGLPPVTKALKELDPEAPQKPAKVNFLEQLTNHRDTFHVGALVPNLISGLQLSFHASLPSEQPVGGVADITNKGSFDKLLTSEFAFDDHVLLSRLANNEALYKHREVPPTDNDHPRVLLIDNTLKNWGTIRTISLAAAIAVAEHPKNKQPCRFFLVGETYREVDLSTVTNVISALRRPDPSLDPGVGLTELFSREDLRQHELFFLGAEASAVTSGMQQLLANSGVQIDHWIHADAQGSVKLYKHPKRGKRLVQELRLPLEELWRRKPKTKKKKRVKPAHVTEYPILFPKMKLIQKREDGSFYYGQTKSRTLVRSYGRTAEDNALHRYGWEVITTSLRTQDKLKAVMTNDDLSVTVLFSTDTKEYSIATYPGGHRITLPLDRIIDASKAFFVEDGQFKSNTKIGQVCIDREGRITHHDTEAWILAPRAQTKNFPYQADNIVRRVQQIAITRDGHLRFHKHDLICNPHSNTFFLTHLGNVEKSNYLIARRQGDHDYYFSDGSYVTHHRNGMLILRSSKPEIPTIYLPARLNMALGAATADVYAGSSYYCPSDRMEVQLADLEEEAARTLAMTINRWMTNTNLQYIEKMVGNRLLVFESAEVIAKAKIHFAQSNYQVSYRGLQQEKVSAETFNKDYIEPFITHILKNATDA